jgi:hypothetical protein
VKWVNITGKNDSNDDNDILVAACMHAGCKVYHLSGGCGSNNNNGKYSISSTCIYHDDSNNHLAYGIDVIGLRYFNVFGRRQDPDGAYAAVIPKFVKMLMK